MDLFLFGIQGSGKGTQAQILTERLGMKAFNTGEALRAIAKEETDLGRQVQSILDAGKHVPAEIVMATVKNFLDTVPAGVNIIFDGIPRNPDQFKSIQEIFQENGRPYVAINFVLDEVTAKERLSGRLTCDTCGMVYSVKDGHKAGDPCGKCGGKLYVRSDDTPEAIDERIRLFNEQTMPLLAHYREMNRLIEIDAQKSPSEVTEALMSALKDL